MPDQVLVCCWGSCDPQSGPLLAASARADCRWQQCSQLVVYPVALLVYTPGLVPICTMLEMGPLTVCQPAAGVVGVVALPIAAPPVAHEMTTAVPFRYVR